MIDALTTNSSPSAVARLNRTIQLKAHFLFRAERYSEAAATYRTVRLELPLERREELAIALEKSGDLERALQVWVGLTHAPAGRHIPSDRWWRAKLNHC